jgi:hypothetical protein
MLAQPLLGDIADLSSSREQSPTTLTPFVYGASAQVLPFNDRTAVSVSDLSVRTNSAWRTLLVGSTA